MLSLGGVFAAYTATIGFTILNVYLGSIEIVEENYRKNKKHIELETFKVKTLAHEIELGLMKHEGNIKSRALATEARAASLAQQLSSGINNLELRMNSLETNMTTEFHNFMSDVNQKMKKLENQPDQLADYSRRMKFGEHRSKFTSFNLSRDCEKMHQVTGIKCDHQETTKTDMDELYKTHYKDKLTPTEFEQIRQQFVSVWAAAARNDGTLAPKMNELFSKPVVLKLLQLTKKL